MSRLRDEVQSSPHDVGPAIYQEAAELRLKLDKTEERLNGTIASLTAELNDVKTKLDDARHR